MDAPIARNRSWGERTSRGRPPMCADGRGAEKKEEGARLPPARGACTPSVAADAPPKTALPVGGYGATVRPFAGGRQGQRGRRTRRATTTEER